MQAIMYKKTIPFIYKKIHPIFVTQIFFWYSAHVH